MTPNDVTSREPQYLIMTARNREIQRFFAQEALAQQARAASGPARHDWLAATRRFLASVLRIQSLPAAGRELRSRNG